MVISDCAAFAKRRATSVVTALAFTCVATASDAATEGAPTMPKCRFALGGGSSIVYELGHLSTVIDASLAGSEGSPLDDLFASFFSDANGPFGGGAGGPFGGATAPRQYRVYFTVCGKNSPRHACPAENLPHAVGVVEYAAPRGATMQPQGAAACKVLGVANEASWAPLDENRPQDGLQLKYSKGSLCKDGRRMQLLFLLRCDLRASASTASLQQRDPCLWTVNIRTPAACPVQESICAPNCPTTWIHDGECDPGCNNEACRFDGGDCSGGGGTGGAASGGGGAAAPAASMAGQCAPGCLPSWLGDKECDEECDNEACGFDGGDCTGVCAPGCQPSWLGDKECDDECNTPT